MFYCLRIFVFVVLIKIFILLKYWEVFFISIFIFCELVMFVGIVIILVVDSWVVKVFNLLLFLAVKIKLVLELVSFCVIVDFIFLVVLIIIIILLFIYFFFIFVYIFFYYIVFLRRKRNVL